MKALLFPIILFLYHFTMAQDALLIQNTGEIRTTDLTVYDAPRYNTFTPRILAHDTNEFCDIGDINQDGHPDIVAGRYWFAGPDFIPRPVRALEEFGDDYSRNSGEFLIDVDQDGWLDVVSNGFHISAIRWYKNPGKEGLAKGLLWKEHLLKDIKIAANEIGLIHDLNKDGQPEYFINSWEESKPMIAWHFDQGEEGQPSLKAETIGQKNGHGIGFGDVNGDGWEDVLFGNGWYEQTKDKQWILHSDWSFYKASCPMIVTDLNGDGRNDIIYGNGHGYGLHWVEQLEPTKEKTQWKEHQIDSTFSQAHALLWEDLNGDGRPELITGKRVRAHSGNDPGSSDTPVVYAYHWDAEKASFDRQIISADKVGTGLIIRIADMDNNGMKDLVMAGKTGIYILFQSQP